MKMEASLFYTLCRLLAHVNSRIRSTTLAKRRSAETKAYVRIPEKLVTLFRDMKVHFSSIYYFLHWEFNILDYCQRHKERENR